LNTKKNKNIKLRYNIVSVFVYFVGIILLVQLFNLQIIKGEEYREQSNTRLSRESTLQAARGNILDRFGNKLATTTSTYVLELYKTKIDTQTLNDTLLKIANTLEQNGDSYVDDLPIKVVPFEFTYTSEESQTSWKTKYKIDTDKTAEECFYILKEKYEISNEDIEEARKIMTLRYTIEKNGYSSTKTVQLATNISENSLAIFNEQSDQFPGVSIQTKAVRNYENGSLASHILGYVSRIEESELKGNEDTYNANDLIGKTGIEYIFEPYLKGTDGTKQIDMAVDGTITGEYITEEAVAGNDVVLTIDANLQKVTEEALKNNIAKIRSGGYGTAYDAEAGSVVVMNVNTGEVLAMASYPDFEPELFVNGISTEKYNEYISEEANHPFINRAISSVSPPGSTFKMVTALAALETGAIKINEKINDVGIYNYSSDYKPKCWLYNSYGRGHGYLNVTEAIKHSCNYFFYELGNRVGIDTLSRYTKALGLGRKTGIELLGEVEGSVSSKETSAAKNQVFTGGNTLQAAIGQHDNSFTPIQMAKYISILANGGNDVNVTIVKGVIDTNGNEVSQEELNEFIKTRLGIDNSENTELDFNKENLDAILEGMRGVTSESGGTAYTYFKNFNIEVGGKTGSAQTGVTNRTNAWFVGFAPFDDPEIAVVVMVENGGSGGYTAEVARDIIAEYFGMNANTVTEDMTAKPENDIVN
jgi:penicillin-binding protein 2